MSNGGKSHFRKASAKLEMNKKGFTLVELLAVIAIISILSLIAVPNVISIVDNNRKDTMLDDAKKLISMAKYEVNIDRDIRESGNYTFSFSSLNKSGDITGDPDGGNYNNASYVKYVRNADGNISYCVSLIGSKRSIGKETCVEETELYSRTIVVDN